MIQRTYLTILEGKLSGVRGMRVSVFYNKDGQGTSHYKAMWGAYTKKGFKSEKEVRDWLDKSGFASYIVWLPQIWNPKRRQYESPASKKENKFKKGNSIGFDDMPADRWK